MKKKDGKKRRRQEERGPEGRQNERSPDPYEIDFLPQFEEGRGPRDPFVNEFGVVIGDHEYVSENSPLERWSLDTDPHVMAGEQWVHNFKDIGFHTEENRAYFEEGIPPGPGMFQHPGIDVSYGLHLKKTGEERKKKRKKDHGDGE